MPISKLNIWSALVVFLVMILWRAPITQAVDALGRRVLVFGGNGFMGSSLVDRLLDTGHNVTMVNRGNWYWDSKERILPRVQHIKCDRTTDHVNGCPELLELIAKEDTFYAVVDFSAQGPHEMREAVKYLKGKVRLYIFISTDAVYDVCDKTHDGFLKETDAVRTLSEEHQKEVEARHEFGHEKLRAEEELMKQRVEENGFPFVILRLPDVVGPRDSTYRWWTYQLWLKLAAIMPGKPVTIPTFLVNYQMSLVYVEDVTKVVVDLLDKGPEIKDQAINLAYRDTFTLERLLVDIRTELGLDGPSLEFLDDGLKEDKNHFYLYPKAKRGPLDVSRAESLLDWSPTPWEDVVSNTVKFFEDIFSNDKFITQRDEIIQVLDHQIHTEDKEKYYEYLEKLYGVELHHFKKAKDEL